MKNIKFLVIAAISLILLFYYKTIFEVTEAFVDGVYNFLNFKAVYGIKIWMIATWGIYKCSFYIWQKITDEPFSHEDTGREYRSLEEARYKEVKHQNQVENYGRDIRTENWIDKDGSRYFIIRVFHELGEFIFVPYKKD